MVGHWESSLADLMGAHLVAQWADRRVGWRADDLVCQMVGPKVVRLVAAKDGLKAAQMAEQ